MTGAATVVWFLGRSRKAPRSEESEGTVELAKTEGMQEARQAVRESSARASRVQQQRGTVAKVVERLAEVRKSNNFAQGIKAAMGGEE